MDTFTYDGSSEGLQKVLDLYLQGGKVVCYRCNTKLLVLPDWESANKHGRRPGIYCRVSEKHIYQWFILSDRREEVWRRFDQLQKERLKEEQ